MSSLKKYKKVKYLGKGSYGAAILVELRSNPSQKFVIKEIVIGHLKISEQNAAKMEAEVLHQMSHSNITMYVESFVESSKLYIVMEHADGGDLTAAIAKRRKNTQRWPEDEVMRIFVQLCLALKHVHEGNILHRDLKCQNVFLTTKGIVKLGDFGIAKVLDASEDQARTQIGTPYYLSPEICESKPYGRKSDVWSLGVILFELLTLEMPFQASSLPALVHRICSTEPSYEKIKAPGNGLVERYSDSMLLLVKSMLNKDPELRPTVKQLVKVDIVRIHISRLLSYTLRAGNGGVGDIEPKSLKQLGAGAGADASPSIPYIDSEDADRDIERARIQERERAQEKYEKDKLNRKVVEREAHREEEREKLRKFRLEMVKKKENSKRQGESGVDGVPGSDPSIDAVLISARGPPSQINRVVDRGIEQHPQHNYQQQQHRAPQSHQGESKQESDRIRRYMEDADRYRDRQRRLEIETGVDSNRILERNRDVRERDGDIYKDRASAISESEYRRYQLEAREAAYRREGQQLYGNVNNRPVLGQQQHRVLSERDRISAPVKSLSEKADRMRDEFDFRTPPLSPQMNPFGKGYRPGGAGDLVAGGSDRHAAAQEYRRAEDPRRVEELRRAVVHRGGGGGGGVVEYESAARREFFANRAAAQASKARVEAAERGERAGASSGVNVIVQHNPIRSPMVHVDPRGGERSERAERERLRENELSRQYDRERERGREKEREREIERTTDPETRIALIKAHKLREQERLVAIKNRQLQEAHMIQREERKRMEDKRLVERERGGEGVGGDALVFDIDFSSRRKEVSASPRISYRAANVVNPGVAVSKTEAVSRSSDLDSKVQPSQRKGWGPPADLLMPVVVRAVPTSSSESKDDNDATINIGKRANLSENFEDEADEDRLNGGDTPMNESLVLKRLEERKDQHQKAREQAKEVFRKLREQRQKQVQAGKLPAGSEVIIKRKSLSTKDSENVSVLATDKSARAASPCRSEASIASKVARVYRMKDVVGSVAKAKESVDLALEAAEAGGPSRRSEEHRRNISQRERDKESAGTRAGDEDDEEHGVEDELSKTLDQWLNSQRSKPINRSSFTRERTGSKSNYTDSSPMRGESSRWEYKRESEEVKIRAREVEEEDSCIAILGASILDRGQIVDLSPVAIASDDEDSGRDRDRCGFQHGESHDDEVAGLQCMLAKELMACAGDDASDEDSTH